MFYQTTSGIAYASIQDFLGSKQYKVYIAIKELKEATNFAISQHLNLPINTITPRVNELRKKLLVEESKKDIDPLTGRKSIYWKLK